MRSKLDARLRRLETQSLARTAPTWPDVQGAISALQTAAHAHLAACLHGEASARSTTGESRATWALVERWCQAQKITADLGEAYGRLHARIETLAVRHATEHGEQV